jgi:dipeptidyl aminopeptidase/acylaminoacyl peptidase
VRVRKADELLGAALIKKIRKGRSTNLYVAPAGEYTWAQVRPLTYFYYDFSNQPEFKFTVAPGKITYPGDLIFHPITRGTGSVQISNRGLAAMDWLRERHPDAYRRYQFEFSGHYPDPFPAFYRGIVDSMDGPVDAGNALLPPPKPGRLPLPVRDLWKEDRIVSARMSPDGDMVAVQLHTDPNHWSVELIDLQSETATTVADSDAEFGELAWSGDGVLLLPVRGIVDGPQDIYAVRIGPSVDGGRRDIARMKLPRKGWVMGSVPGHPDQLLFASIGTRGELLVHHMDIGSQQALDSFQYNARDRLNIGVKDDLSWFTDGRGRLRLALAQREEDGPDDEGPRYRLVLMYGQDGRFEEVMRIDQEDPFIPVGLSPDGSVVYGITEKDRSQRELVAFDPVARKFGRTLFSKPGVDVQSAIFDSQQSLVGVTYYRGGFLVSEYFDEANDAQARLLRETFPGKTVLVGGRSRDGRQLLLWVDGGDQPLQLYHLDIAARRASLLEESKPWLKAGQLSPSETFGFKGVDGMHLEAFLTMPRNSGKHPLIVFPHGGPIGVSDTLHFDPEVQFLASLGYAVLRVNYRGSEGYGKAFREAGYRKYGTAIEDDIDAATQYALAHYPLDASRMCAVGSSYGGYSSLVSAIRWPKRFRCVVSIAGVSDKILLFTASDASNDKERRKALEELIGDPRTQLEEMKATSPIYHYRELKVPVMLVHGTDDLRVDYEHAFRLERMLAIDGRPPVGMVFDKEGHGMERIDDIEAMWNGIAGFLQAHLGAGP